eukprot:TRINITY_DN12157_c0_g1_i1.p1 TRINITY_DN12157_c0_g1~~TRINITY_DN12157_c0_g1_i1.p1  ORF type:complete len:541 (-),score=20.58 TRINITY_DN12157_c0_g1_i1:411-2033(-)
MPVTEYDLHSYVFLALGGLLYLAVGWAFLRSSIRDEVLSRLRQAVARISLAARCGRVGSILDGDDPIEQYVIKQMDAVRKKRIVKTFYIVIVFLTGTTGVAWMKVLNLEDDRWQSPAQDMLMCIGSLAILSLQQCSWTARSKAVTWSYSLAMIYCLIYVQCSLYSRFSVVCASVQMVFMRLIFVAAGLEVHVVLFWNTLCCIGSVASFSRSPIDATLHLTPLALLSMELCYTAVIAFSTGVFSELARGEIRQDAVATSSKLENGAMSALLENAYDVTLSLNEDLLVTGDATRFAALIGVDPARGRAMDVKQYMPLDEDRTRFDEQLRREAVTDEPVVTCMSVCMHDTRGSQFNVEMLGVAFKKLDQSTTYLLGLREIADLHLAPITRLDDSEIQERPRRRRRVTAGQGTQPSIIGNRLADGNDREDVEDRLTDTTETRSNSKFLVLPRMEETSELARLSTMISLLHSWNVDGYLRPCCPFHAGLLEIKRMLETLNRGPCQKSFYDDVLNQCRACGLLNSLDVNNACTHCGADHPVPAMAL